MEQKDIQELAGRIGRQYGFNIVEIDVDTNEQYKVKYKLLGDDRVIFNLPISIVNSPFNKIESDLTKCFDIIKMKYNGC